MNCNDTFAFNDFTVTRGHSYKLYAKTSRISVRHNFFCNLSSTYGIVFPRVTITLKSFLAVANPNGIIILTVFKFKI